MTDRPNLDPWSNGTYTDDQLGKLSTAIKHYDQKGEPQHSTKIKIQMDGFVPFENIVLPDYGGNGVKRGSIRPETNIDPSLVDEPPRSGKGSGQKHWAEFASLVTDMDDEVIDQMSRDELIEILIARDVIDEA